MRKSAHVKPATTGLPALGVGAERRQRHGRNLSRQWGGLCVNAFAKCAQSFASGLGFAPRDTASTRMHCRRAANKQFMTAWYCAASSSPHLNNTHRAVDVLCEA